MPQSAAQSKHVGDDIKALSEAWIAGCTQDDLIKIMPGRTKHQAMVEICRLRQKYGSTLFPHRKAAIASGGYSTAKVKRISKLWKAMAPYESIADELGFTNPDSIWAVITLLRKEYGEDMFPRRRDIKKKAAK
jgi:hypothetical protein